MRSPPRRHADWIAGVGFAAIAVLLAGPAIVGQTALGPDIVLDWDPLYRTQAPPALPFSSDYTPIVVDHPKEMAIARALRAGRLDVWNPLVGCGAPLWADHVGPFFPLKLPFYLAPSRQTYHLFLALRLVAAGIGAYVLARRRGLASLPAFVAGASFELCGASISHLPFGAASAPYVLPWVVLGSYVIAERCGPRAVAGAALALGIAGGGGHPPLVLSVFAGFAAAIAGHAAARWRQPRQAFAVVVAGGLAVLLGLALAAPTLLPLAELVDAGSSYKHRFIGALMRTWQFNETRSTLPMALFAPGWFARLHPHLQTALAFSPSVGVLGLTLAVTGLFGRGLDAPLAVMAGFGIGLALAPPGLHWIDDLPGLHLVLPTNAWPLVLLPVTQIAGHGAAAVAAPSGWRRGLVALALVCAAGASLLLVQDVPPKAFAGALRAVWEGPGGRVALAWPPLVALLALLACAGLTRAGRPAWAPAVVCAVMLVERLITMVPFTRQPVAAASPSAPSPAVAFLQSRDPADRRLVGLPYVVGYPLSPMRYGLADLRNVTGLPVRRYFEYLQAITPKAGTYAIQDAPVAVSPLLDLAAVRYLVVPAPELAATARGLKEALLLTPPELPADDPMLVRVYGDERVVVYENRAAVPRVRIVHRADRVAGEDAARLAARAIGQRPGHADAALAATVIVEPDEHGQALPALDDGPVSAETARLVDHRDPDRLVIEARLERDGLIVVADTYYPGWQAWVDGVPTAVHAVNLLFRGVFAPAGEHLIELRYRPRSLRWGAAACLAAVVVCVVCLRLG